MAITGDGIIETGAGDVLDRGHITAHLKAAGAERRDADPLGEIEIEIQAEEIRAVAVNSFCLDVVGATQNIGDGRQRRQLTLGQRAALQWLQPDPCTVG